MALRDYLDREFGELPESTLEHRTQDRATRLLDIAPSASPDVEAAPSGIPEWKPSARREAPSDSGFLEDNARLLGAGTVSVGEMGLGALEYAGRSLAGEPGSVGHEILSDITGGIQSGRESLAGVREGILKGVTPELLEQAGREFLTLDPERTLWQGSPLEVANGIAAKFVQTLPATLAVMLPAARLFRAGNTRGAVAYLGASEGGLSLGGIQNNLADEIKGMTHEELLSESQAYRGIYEQQGDEAVARQELTRQTQGAAPLIGGAAVAAISMVAGRYLEPVFAPAKGEGRGLGSRAATGFLAEAPQEGSQGATERLMQNFAAQLYDENRNLSEGVAEAAVEEGVIGGLTGGAVAGAFGQRPARPTPPPAIDEGGQMGLPGFGPQQREEGFGIEPPGYRDDTPEGQYVPNTGMGLQTEFPEFIESDSTEAVMVPEEQAPGQGVLPLGIAGTESLAQRGPDHRTLQEGDVIPDEYDQPTAEPQDDLEAQLADMKTASGRSAVYVSPEQRVIPQIPKGAVEIRNFDGKGGTLIAKNQAAANHARKLRAEGGSMQAIIGELTMAGAGKPNVRAGYAVQLVDESGAVARESLVRTKAEANALEKEWGKDGTTRVLSGPDALARRGAKIEEEQVGEGLRTEDPALVDQATPDMFEQAPTALTAAENQSKAGAFQVQMKDEQGNEIVTEQFATVEEAEARADELIKDFPDAFVTSKQTRVAAEPTKAGLRTTKYAKRKVLKGPPEGPPKGMADEDVSTERTRPPEVSITPEEFDETVSVKDIEGLPNFEATYSVITEEVQPNKTTKIVEKRESREFTSRGAARSYATRMTNKARKAAPKDYDVKEGKVDALDSPELEASFASALQSRADRKQETTAEEEGKKVGHFATDEAVSLTGEGVTDTSKELTAEYRSQNTTPSQKVQFIRRERASVLRRKAPTKNVGAAKVTTVKKGGGTQETETKALTYETVSGEETTAQEISRKAKVKEANTRLRFALNRAKKFLDRFNTTGEYGTYVSDNTNVNGTLTQAARDFMSARAVFHELVDFANSALASGNTSNAHADMAKKIAIALERVKLGKMTPQQFAKEFSAVAKSTDYKMLKNVPARFKESATVRDQKIAKNNNERRNANARQDRLENRWGKDKIWTENVGPIFRKFADAMLSNVARPATNSYYNPTEQEIEGLRYALRTFRKMTERYPHSEFYTPVKEQLEYYGFEFDADGDLIVQDFSPSDNLLSAGFIAKYGVSKKAAEEVTGTGPVRGEAIVTPDSAAMREERDKADKVKAVSGINMANALIEKLKSMISSKTTINGIKRQEQRFIRGLRKLGVWTDTAPGMGKISFGGYATRTYRLVGPRLDKSTMTKGEAKGVIDHLKRFAMPRELAAAARLQQNVDAASTTEAFVESNSTEFFLEELDLAENSPALDNAASTVGDMIRDRYSQIGINDVLDTIIGQLPENHFYRQLAERLRAADMTDVTLQYDWTNSKFFGKKRNHLGMFDPGTNRAYLNRKKMLDDMDVMTGSKAIHTMLHEILHAATHNSLARSRPLRNRMFQIRAAAYHAWVKANGNKNVPIGLRLTDKEGNPMPIDEFVVEVFADESLQDHLRNTPVELEGSATGLSAAWSRIKDILIEILGWGNVPETRNLLDGFMSTADQVFEHAGIARPGSEVLNLELYDGTLANTARSLWDKVAQRNAIVQRVKDAGGSILRNIQTLEQFVENYAKEFIIEGESSLEKYSKAFNQRNARASEYMNVPQRISRAWTKLEETDPAGALEVTRIGTEASLNQVTAAEAPEDGDATHADIHARYNALSAEAKKVYQDTKNYYADASQREHMFLLQSALRGVLTNKSGVGLDIDIFNAKFNVAELEKIESREDLSNMIGEYIPDEARSEMIDQLYRMSVVPRQQKGDYFPAMRYGDEVVYAEKLTHEQIFEDRKEAWGVRGEIAATDPTLDVQMLKTDDGQWAVRTFEREFVMAESVSEIEEAHARLVQEYGAENVFDPQKRRSKQTDIDIGSNQALNSIIKTLDGNPAAQAAIKNLYLRSLSEASFRKHEMKRKNRRGLNYDIQHRNLAAYAKQASYYTSQLEFGWKMAEALKEMDAYVSRRQAGPNETSTRKLRAIVNHLHDRDQMSVDLPDIHQLVRMGVEYTHFFMLTSPSYWAINATQPWLVSAPTMAGRHGWGQTIATMAAIQKLIKAPLIEQAGSSKGGFAAFFEGGKSKLEDAFDVIHQLETHIKENAPAQADEYIALLEKLRSEHIIDINVFTEMRDQAAGKSQSAADKTIDASRIMAHLTEVNNRVLTALSAYQLEINAGSTVEEATKYAGDIVSQTQFNYSSGNKPPLFQAGGPMGGVAPLMFQFMQWPQHMYAHLIRNYRGMVDAGVMNKSEARSALLGLLGTHLAVGGMVGMTLQPIKWAIGFVMMALGDDDEPYTFANAVNGRTADRLMTSTFDDLFGTTAATFLAKGIPAGLGIDLSTRMSMGTVYFVDLRGDTAESNLGSIVASFGGATLNQGINLARGMGRIADGDIMRGIEQMSPKIARDFLRSIRYYNEGLVNNAGDTVIPASEMGYGEIVPQILGFAPTDIAQFYEAQNAIKDAEAHARDRKEELLKQFRLAAPGERASVMSEVRAFNRSYPVERITYSTLLSNVKGKKTRESRFRRYGANIDERKARFYKEYGDPYRDE
jgi:hypothetical protein